MPDLVLTENLLLRFSILIRDTDNIYDTTLLNSLIVDECAILIENRVNLLLLPAEPITVTAEIIY